MGVGGCADAGEGGGVQGRAEVVGVRELLEGLAGLDERIDGVEG